jgi:hypothetical protein
VASGLTSTPVKFTGSGLSFTHLIASAGKRDCSRGSALCYLALRGALIRYRATGLVLEGREVWRSVVRNLCLWISE